MVARVDQADLSEAVPFPERQRPSVVLVHDRPILRARRECLFQGQQQGSNAAACLTDGGAEAPQLESVAVLAEVDETEGTGSATRKWPSPLALADSMVAAIASGVQVWAITASNTAGGAIDEYVARMALSNIGASNAASSTRPGRIVITSGA